MIQYVSGCIRSFNFDNFKDWIPDIATVAVEDSGGVSKRVVLYYYGVVQVNGRQFEVMKPSDQTDVVLYRSLGQPSWICSREVGGDPIPQIDSQDIDLQSFKYPIKWNRYYDASNYRLSQQGLIQSPYFKFRKYNVLTCQFGALPGFNSYGQMQKSRAQAMNLGLIDPPEIIADEFAMDIKPLKFTVKTQSYPICFWYTDTCAECVEGSMTFRLSQNIQTRSTNVNSIGVICYDAKTEKTQKVQYYDQPNEDKSFKSDYASQSTQIQRQQSTDHLLSIRDYSVIGLSKNNGVIDVAYKSRFAGKNQFNLHWELTKTSTQLGYNILTQIKNESSFIIALQPGVYTVIPTNAQYLDGVMSGVSRLLSNNINQNFSSTNGGYDLDEGFKTHFRSSSYMFTMKELQKVDFKQFTDSLLFTGLVDPETLLDDCKKIYSEDQNSPRSQQIGASQIQLDPQDQAKLIQILDQSASLISMCNNILNGYYIQAEQNDFVQRQRIQQALALLKVGLREQISKRLRSAIEMVQSKLNAIKSDLDKRLRNVKTQIGSSSHAEYFVKIRYDQSKDPMFAQILQASDVPDSELFVSTQDDALVFGPMESLIQAQKSLKEHCTNLGYSLQKIDQHYYSLGI